MTVDNRAGYIAFALRVLAILTGLAVLTALLGIGVRGWAPGFDLQTLQAIAGLLLGWSWALLVFHWARPKLASNNTVTVANSTATN